MIIGSLAGKCMYTHTHPGGLFIHVKLVVYIHLKAEEFPISSIYLEFSSVGPCHLNSKHLQSRQHSMMTQAWQNTH